MHLVSKEDSQFTEDRPRVALVLQGGGALGAYHGGVYQALHENNLAPDWVVGTSIGAINAALIAGNSSERRVEQLDAFWEQVAQNDVLNLYKVSDEVRRVNSWMTAFNCTVNGVHNFFVPRWFNPFAMGMPVSPENASFYDPSPLAETLGRLIDLDCLNAPEITRLSVNAVQVRCGKLMTFDTSQQRLGIEHVMASGALPPAFPPVRIDGELYWDGGLYSNTPLETVLNDEPRIETLCFMVDLWSAEGPEPHTLDEVTTREKDVMYASRSQRHIETYLREHKLRQTIRALHEQIPPAALTPAQQAELDALGSETTMHVVRLAYSGRDWQMASKDVNFSRGSIAWRWEQGYRDALVAIKAAAWRTHRPEGAGIVLHEIRPDGSCVAPGAEPDEDQDRTLISN